MWQSCPYMPDRFGRIRGCQHHMPRPRTATPTYSLIAVGNWFYVSWWQDNKSHREALGTDQRETAKRRLQEWISARGKAPKPEIPTVGAILAAYLADRTPRVAAPATLRHCCQALTDLLGDVPPEALTRDRCREYARSRVAAGRRGATGKKQPLSNGTVIRELVTLRAALRWAAGEGWMATDPYIELPPAPRPKDRWLTRPEAAKLIDACKTPHVRLFVTLALYTAGRASAILELTWQQVSLDRGIIDLGTGTGNKRRAKVPIGKTLRQALTDAANIRTACGKVVEFRGQPVACIRHAFRDAAKAAGLPGVTPHTLRHTAATWLVQAGIPLAEVARFLGDSEQMVEKVYGHHSPEYLRGAADALDG